MRCSATFFKWLLLVVAGSLGSCQRAAYQFQNPPAAYQVPSVAPGASAVVRSLNTYSTTKPLHIVLRQEPRASRRQRVLPLHLPLTGAHHQRPAAKLPLKKAGEAPSYLSANNQSQQEPLPNAPLRWRSRGIALLLALFLGGFGAHLFYLGYHRRALLYLLLTIASTVLVGVAAALFIAALFSGGAAGFFVFSLVALLLASVVGVLSLIDTIFILTDDLKPKDGEYYPRFFQTRSRP